MDRLEITELIKNDIKSYFQIAEAIEFFHINELTLKKYAVQNGLFENPAKLKKTKSKRPVLKAKETLKVMQELGYPKLKRPCTTNTQPTLKNN